MADFNVKTTAAGGGDGSAGNPYTLQEAFDAVTAGNRILVWDGTYTLTATVDIDTQAGTEANPIQIVGVNSSGTEDGTRPVITTASTLANGLLRNGGANISYLRFRNLDLNGGGTSKAAYCLSHSNSNSSAEWSFIDCLFHGATSHGVYVRNRMTFVRCAFYSNAGSGLEYFSSGGHAYSVFVSCRFHNNTTYGAKVNAAHITFSKCLFYRNGADGLARDGTAAAGLVVLFSTFYLNTGDGIDIAAACDGLTLVGNTMVDNGGYGLKVNAAFPYGGTCDFNHTHGNTSGACDVTLPGEHNQTGDPGFANTGSGTEDFTPANAGVLDNTGPAPATNVEVDIGAGKAADPAGGGGGPGPRVLSPVGSHGRVWSL